MTELERVLAKAQRIADDLVEECRRIRPGDIGGRLLARSIAEFVVDKAAQQLESRLDSDGGVG